MKRFTRLLLIAALLYGTGAHWAAIQGVAWGKMIADRAVSQGLSGAVTSTFSGKTPCGVCIVVDRGARSQQPERVVSPSVHFIAAGPLPAVAPIMSSHLVATFSTSVPESSRRPDSPPPKTSPVA